MAKLTIVSVSWHSARYLEPLLANLRAKAAAPNDLSVLIVDNTGGADEELRRLAAPSAQIIPFQANETNGSRAHAKALDFVLPRICTAHAVIVDPDIHVFLERWDERCREALQAHDGVAIGAPYPSWKVGKYHDFPSPPFCFFDTAAIASLGVGFAPFPATRVEAARVFALRQLGRAGGLLTRRRYERSALVRRYAARAERTLGVFGPDTGWRIAEACRARGRRAILFDAVLAARTRDRADDVRSSDADVTGVTGVNDALATLAHEFELYTYEGQPAMTHKYGSGARPWRTERGGDEELWRRCVACVEGR